MGDFVAEIRSIEGGDSPGAVDPGRVVVTHHRAGQAELSVNMLSGGHPLHLALAGCVFNSVYRIAADRNIVVSACRVTVDGEFDDPPPRSTGISYEIELAGAASEDALSAVARFADEDSTVPNLLRASTSVVLRKVRVSTTSGGRL